MSDTHTVENEEIIVTLGADGEPIVAGAAEKKPGEPAKAPAKTPADDAVDDLAGQFATMKSRLASTEAQLTSVSTMAQTATARATKAEAEVSSARAMVIDSQMDSVVAGIDASQAEADAAQTEYVAALEEGNFEKAGKAQRKMSAAESRRALLENAKADLESQPKPTRRAASDEPPPRPAVPTDPVEAYVQGRSPKTSNWLRGHPDFITDPGKNNKLTAGHFDAVAAGIAVDTDEYFQHVEKFIGLKKDAAQPRKEDTPGRRPPSTTAPVSPSGGGTSGGSQDVKLTKGEAAAAVDGTHVWNYDDQTGQNRFKKGDPIGLQEFAKRKAKMMKDGLYDRTYTES